MNFALDEKNVQEKLESGYIEAQRILNDKDKLEKFLERLEEKLKLVPVVGGKLACIPVLASMLRSYAKKEYTDIPIGTLLAVTSALIYFVSPIDIVPDSIPVLGYSDDAAVVALCWKWVESDANEYIAWRKTHKK